MGQSFAVLDLQTSHEKESELEKKINKLTDEVTNLKSEIEEMRKKLRSLEQRRIEEIKVPKNIERELKEWYKLWKRIKKAWIKLLERSEKAWIQYIT